MNSLVPGQPVPSFTVPTLAGDTFDLAKAAPTAFTMLVVYRGLHCPVCHGHLKSLAESAEGYRAEGVEILAVSTDERDRCQTMADEVGTDAFSWGHDLPLATARAWGLYLSQSRGKTSIDIEETAIFAEPGIFLVKPDNTLFYVAVQSMPFARPAFAELLGGVKFVNSKGYPARGTYTGTV